MQDLWHGRGSRGRPPPSAYPADDWMEQPRHQRQAIQSWGTDEFADSRFQVGHHASSGSRSKPRALCDYDHNGSGFDHNEGRRRSRSPRRDNFEHEDVHVENQKLKQRVLQLKKLLQSAVDERDQSLQERDTLRTELRQHQEARSVRETELLKRITELQLSLPPQGWYLDNLKQMEANLKEFATNLRELDPSRHNTNKLKHRVYTMSLMDLKFTHASIANRFQNGRHEGTPIFDLVNELKNRTITTEQVKPLVVVKSNKFGHEVVCGNRRLYCYRMFALDQAEILLSIKVRCVVWDIDLYDKDAFPTNLLAKYVLSKTSNDGDRIPFLREVEDKTQNFSKVTREH